MVWILSALGCAFFMALGTIFAKIGIKGTSPEVVTAVRTLVVFAVSVAAVFAMGVQGEIAALSRRVLIFAALSGLSSALARLAFYKGITLGDVTRVMGLQKANSVLTILAAFIFFHDAITPLRAAAALLIGAGVCFMIKKEPGDTTKPVGASWVFYGALSAVLMSLTAVLGKLGVSGASPEVVTMLRTAVVLLVAWGIVFWRGEAAEITKIPKKEILYMLLSGASSGTAWLLYYRALKYGPLSACAALLNLGIVVVTLFSALYFHHRPSRNELLGIAGIVGGALLMAL